MHASVATPAIAAQRTEPAAKESQHTTLQRRPTTALSKLADSIDQSPLRVAQAKRVAGIFDGREPSAQAGMIDTSPRLTAQVQRKAAIFGTPVQQHKAPAHHLPHAPEEDELHQLKAAPSAQATSAPNRTGLPHQLKAGIEALSGISLDGVKVHYNSGKPAQLHAHAYAQGSDIHLAPGQEKHLPHEAWHVVQQAQGRVKPTLQMKGGVPVNDDAGLEREADVMGARAAAGHLAAHSQMQDGLLPIGPVIQGRFVHFHSTPPAAAASDGTWVTQSAQVVGEVRPPFRQATVTALAARQPTMAAAAGQAIGHINAWGTMIAHVVNLAGGGRTIQQVATQLNTDWPTTSVIANPGVPAALTNDSLADYAEAWLDARHNDPANLFYGNSAENSARGDQYDNPTKAKGPNGRSAGSAFSAAEKQALVGQQITALTSVAAGGVLQPTQVQNQIGVWLGGYDLLPTNQDMWRTLERRQNPTSFATMVDFLANEKVFTKIELTRVFRTDTNPTGAV